MQVAEARERQLGSFKVVRELNQVGTASIYSARPSSGPADGPAGHAIKLIQIPKFVAPGEATRRLEAFVLRAQAQQRVAAATANGGGPGASHWAPIHEGPTRTDDEAFYGAFYVSDLYTRSCDALLDGRRGSLTVRELWELVRQVAAGLRELKESQGRAHGNLKPGNVLLSGRGRRLRAFLTDPGDAATASEAADCQALGALVHRVVLHALPPDDFRGELPARPQWTALGPKGHAWRAFCGRLLMSSSAGASVSGSVSGSVSDSIVGSGRASRSGPIASYKQLDAEIEALRPSINPIWWQAAAIAAAIIVIGIAGFALASKRSAYSSRELDHLRTQWEPFEKVGESKEDWAERLKPYIQYAGRDDRAQVEAIVDSISRVTPPDAIQVGLLHWDAQRRITQDLVLIDQEIYPKLDELSRRLKLSPESVRHAPVRYLTEFPLRLGWADRLPRAREDIEIVTGALRANPIHDPVIEKLRKTIQADQENQEPDFSKGGDVATTLDRFDAFHERAPRIAAIIRGHYDFTLIANREAATRSAQDDDPSHAITAADRWIEQAEQYRITEQGAADRAALGRRIKDLAERASALGSTGTDATLKGDIDRKQREIEEWVKSPVHVSDIDEVNRKTASYRNELDKLASSVQQRLSDPGVWTPRLSNTANQAQIERLRRFIHENGTSLPEQIASNRSHAAELQDRFDHMATAVIAASANFDPEFDPDHHPVLFDVRGEVAPSIASWVGALNRYSADRRDKVLEEALPKTFTDQPSLQDALDKAALQWKNWRNQTRELVDTLLDRQHSLSVSGGMYPPGSAPDDAKLMEQWSKQFDKWKADLTSTDKAPDELTRDPLSALRMLDFAKAIKASNPAEAGLALKAWEEVPDQLARPDGVHVSIDDDFAAWQRLRDWAAKTTDPTRRDALTVELKRRLVDHWKAWGAHPTTALKLSPANPEFQYNCAMYNLLYLVNNGSADEESVAAALKDVIARARDAKQNEIAGALADLLKEPVIDPTTILDWGPRKMNWTIESLGPGRVRFTNPTDERFQIEFARVDAAEGSGVYMATTEVSAALYFHVLPRALRPSPKTKDDQPKAWMIGGKGEATGNDKGTDTTVNDGRTWIVALGANGNAIPENGSATLACPMTFVTPSDAQRWAERIGCRLPTASEWRAALTDETSRKASPKWNLRDATWTNFSNFVRMYAKDSILGKQLRDLADPAKWDWFDPGNSSADAVWNATLTGAGNPPWDDGRLFFLPADPGEAQRNNGTFGHKYFHLIGNAAEIVTMTPLPQAPARFAVIGGSAFSPPQLGYDRADDAPADRSWCDVGFRLAIGAPRKPLQERIAQGLKPVFVQEP